MARVEELYLVFENFAAFGSSRNLVGSLTDVSGPTLDGAKFAKFTRDSDLLSKTVTPTDVDIIFNKVKSKTARRIDFEQFQAALRLIAEKRYGSSRSPTEAYTTLVNHIINSGARPLAKATSVSNDNITARLTDHTLYTGTHKNRFDENGKGRGLAGRDGINKTSDLSQLTTREPATIRGLPLSVASDSVGTTKPLASSQVATGAKRGHAAVVTASSERLDSQLSSTKQVKAGSQSNLAKKPIGGSTSSLVKGSNTNLKASDPRPLASSNQKLSSSKDSVFDRLNDHNCFTGTHKHRFNPDGTGRGIAGRDTAAKGNGSTTVYRGGDVKNLSQILRQ